MVEKITQSGAEVAARRGANQQPIARTLAEFATGLRHEDVPGEVRVRAVHHMLDAAGIALASARYDFAHRMLTGVRALAGEGNVPVIGMPARLNPRDAAMINGFLCHGLDFDDTHIAGIIHPTSSLFPAVMSAAAMSGATGQAAVTAYVVGVEAATRLASVARSGFHQVGFHPTGMVGVFGCALAAGRLLGLTARQLESAQGIALSMASGSLQFLDDGAWNKRLHPGWAAQAGITAAVLARDGFQGASAPYEGRFGLYNSYLGTEAGRADLSLATEGLGTTWQLMQTAIKPFPACHFTHGCIDAALAIAAQGIDTDRIRSIEALVPEGVVKTVCEPEASKKSPANSYDAQFSTHYLVAAALIRRRFGLAELEPDALSDKAILELTRKVSYRVDPDSPFPAAYSGELVVTLEDGRVLRHREQINRGAADRPLTNAEIVDKYRLNAGLCVDGERAQHMRESLIGLDELPRAADVLAAFSPAA